MSRRRAPLLQFTPPSLARAMPAPPTGSDWVHETKHDGYRLQALIETGRVRLLTRTALDWTPRFGIVSQDLAALRAKSAVLDCEAVVLDPSGASRFAALQAELKKGRDARIVLIAFDLMHLDGRTIAQLPLSERKQLLERLITRAALPHGLLRFGSHMEGDGAAIFRQACSLGLEGIVSKRRDRPYRSGRTSDWVKSKCTMSDPFVVVGYVPSKATSGIVGALVLGFYAGDRLVYAGRVGSGFTMAEARALADGLAAIPAPPPLFAKSLSREQRSGVSWIEPRLVAQVAYRDVTQDGIVRHATFQHFREDKPAAEIAMPPSFARLSGTAQE